MQQEWRWTERYAQQPEILRYIAHVVERFDLRKDIVFQARMTRAEYDESSHRWTITAQDGRQWQARFLILAVGQLSLAKRPNYPGQDTFKGEIIHSGEWPKRDVDLAGKRVAIIGTGSSGMQMTPVIANVASHLTVFQRTANFSIPAANAPVTDEEDRRVKANYAARREQAANSPSGLGFIPNKQSALDVTPVRSCKRRARARSARAFGRERALANLVRRAARQDARGRVRERRHAREPSRHAAIRRGCRHPHDRGRGDVGRGRRPTLGRDDGDDPLRPGRRGARAVGGNRR